MYKSMDFGYRKLAVLSFPLVAIYGGAAKATLLSSKYLSLSGWNVKNFSLGCSNSESMSFAELKIECYASSEVNTHGRVRLAEFMRFCRDFSNFKPELILTHQIFNLATCFAVSYGRLKKIPVAVCPHGSLDHKLRNRNTKLFPRLIKTMMVTLITRWSDLVLFNSKQEQIASRLRVQSKFKIVDLGIEVPHVVTNNPKRDDAIVFFGRLDPIKRLDLVITSLAILKSEGFNIDLHIYGSGDKSYEIELKNLVEKLNLLNQVHFMPWKNESELAVQMSKTKVVISASDSESFGLSLLESLAYGAIAVMGSHLPHSDFVREMKLGYLVNKQTPEDYATAIKLALLDCEDSENKGDFSHANFAQYEWKVVIKTWNECLSNLLKPRV